MSILVTGLSHHTSPVTVREKFAFAEGDIPCALEKLQATGWVDEAVILSTCNRVELYVSTSRNAGETSEALTSFLVDYHSYGGPLADEIYAFEEPKSIEHLFRVACGLESMVLGETEVLGQLKKAYETALLHKRTGPRLNKTFQRAFNVAKEIRTHTGIQRGNTSVGSVAVELAEKIFDSLEGRRVMVIGAGDTSEKTARALISRGSKSVLVANRTYDRAVELAQSLGGTAVHWDHWAAECERTDIVISSTAAPRYILTKAKVEPVMRARKGRPLLLIDIAVPRDIDPEVHYLENIYLYNIDDLQAIADDCLRQRKDEIERCEAIIRTKVEETRAGLRYHKPDGQTQASLQLAPPTV